MLVGCSPDTTPAAKILHSNTVQPVFDFQIYIYIFFCSSMLCPPLYTAGLNLLAIQ